VVIPMHTVAPGSSGAYTRHYGVFGKQCSLKRHLYRSTTWTKHGYSTWAQVRV